MALNGLRFILGVDNVYHLKWSKDLTYGDIRRASEVEGSKYNIDYSDAGLLARHLRTVRKSLSNSTRQALLIVIEFSLECSHLSISLMRVVRYRSPRGPNILPGSGTLPARCGGLFQTSSGDGLPAVRNDYDDRYVLQGLRYSLNSGQKRFLRGFCPAPLPT